MHLIPQKTLDLDIDLLDQDVNVDLEGIISEKYQRPDKSCSQEPPELQYQVDTGKVVQMFLLKQADIDKILKPVQRKVLKETHLPVTVKEIQVGYFISPYFKDIYLYLAHNKLPNTKSAITKMEMLLEQFILLD